MPEAGTLTTRLARLRVPLGFVFGALVLWLAAPTARTLAAGGAVACVGEAIRIWAAGHLNKAREVTMSGPYRWMAHPLYVGSSVMGAGLAIAAGGLLAVALVGAYLAVTLTAAIRSEEALLRQRFGDAYDRYRGAASREAAGAAEGRRFSLRQALANREPRAVAGLLVAWLLLALKATYNGTFWQPGG
jgi:protein-S-isoprenylcysteine O-methyltransferase Ste14